MIEELKYCVYGYNLASVGICTSIYKDSIGIQDVEWDRHHSIDRKYVMIVNSLEEAVELSSENLKKHLKKVTLKRLNKSYAAYMQP